MIPREGEAIDILRYAEVMGHLRYFPADKHAEVIARLGIRRRDWDAAAAKWQRVRDDERLSGKLEVTVRFGRVMADTRAKLEARQPTLESLGPLPGPDGTPAQSAAPSGPAGAKAAPTREPDAAGPVPAPVVQVPSYVAAQQFSAAPALIESSPASHPRPPVLRPPAQLASTLPHDSSLPTAAALPFAAPTVSTVMASHPRPPVLRPPLELGGTSLSVDVGQGPALPFNPGASHSSPGHPQPPVLRLPPGLPDLTVQQYASLHADLNRDPEHVSATLSRYRLSPAMRGTLVAYWDARFAADPLLAMTFASAHATYVAWIKANPGV